MHVHIIIYPYFLQKVKVYNVFSKYICTKGNTNNLCNYCQTQMIPLHAHLYLKYM